MKSKKPLILLCLSIILTISYASLPWAAPKARFSVIYTNDVMGEVEPCG